MVLNTEHRKCHRDGDLKELGIPMDVTEDRLVELLYGNKVLSTIYNHSNSIKFRLKSFMLCAVSVDCLTRDPRLTVSYDSGTAWTSDLRSIRFSPKYGEHQVQIYDN